MKACFGITALAAAALAAAGAWAQEQPLSGAGDAESPAPLTRAADALRESIQGMEQHPNERVGAAIAAASGQPSSGCWARLHEQPDYGGKALTLAGGTDVAEVARSLGGDWQGIGSVVVGPGARLVTRTKDLFGEATMTIAQGQELPDVTRTEPPGLFASIDQMEIACTG